MSVTGVFIAILLTVSPLQQTTSAPLPNRPGARALVGLVIPDDRAAAVAQADRLEAEGRDALGMGFRFAAERFEMALALRRSTPEADTSAIVETLRLLAAAYSQQGYPAIAADLLAQASSTGAGQDATGRLAELRAREGDYLAVREVLVSAGNLDSLDDWDQAFLDAMVAYQDGDLAQAERRLSSVVSDRTGGQWFWLPVHRFRALIALIEARQSLGMTGETLSAARTLLEQLASRGQNGAIDEDLPRREAEQEISRVAAVLIEAGVRSDHIGETADGAWLLAGGLELGRYWPLNDPRSVDGSIRLAEASLTLGQPNTARTIADRFDEAQEAILAQAIRARVSGAEAGTLSRLEAGIATSTTGSTAAYVLGVASTLAASERRDNDAATFAQRAVEHYRADLSTDDAWEDDLDREITTSRLAEGLTTLSQLQIRLGLLDPAELSLQEALELQIARWCPEASEQNPIAGYGWGRDPRGCLGHPALALSVETGAALATARQRPTVAARLYRHAGDIALGHTLGRYGQQTDARLEFTRSARFHRAFVTSAWRAVETAETTSRHDASEMRD